jgi:cob(I)alamin adenosyltransferase
MANRLTRIYTRTGDDGTTGLAYGSRVAKDHARIEALGAVDELNSTIGLLLCEALPPSERARLVLVQHRLFDLGGELAIPGQLSLTDAHVAALENWMDEYNATLGSLKEFILPGGCRAAGVCHLARSVARRAERRLISLGLAEPVSAPARQFVNRLSDFLFVLARELNRVAGISDVYWQKNIASNG